MRSTSWATAAFASFEAPGGLAVAALFCFERKTGLEPATYSLEGYRSTKWATSASLKVVGKSGLEPLNSEEDRFTVCCNCHYATSPLIPMPFGIQRIEPMKGLEPPTGWLQISYSTNWVTSAFQCFKQLFFLDLRLQRYYFFTNWKIFFQLFFAKRNKNIDFQHYHTTKNCYYFTSATYKKEISYPRNQHFQTKFITISHIKLQK